tara:strand:+ start:1516 stop:2595 length:1080 start_codon:yes stop_codon:yes gene_type:complete
MAYTTIDTPESYFNVVTYTGNGSTQSITGVGFQPDMVWLKSRNASGDHVITDSSRGTGKQIMTNGSNTDSWEETEQSATNRITSFDSDGFSLGANAEGNTNGDTYVAWCWKLNGGTTETIAAGSTSYDPSESTVQKNLTANITISEYQGSTSYGSYSHGLGEIPAFTLIKAKTIGSNAPLVYLHNARGYDNAGYLTTGTGAGSALFDAAPTSSVVNCKDVNPVFRPQGTKSYVAWHFGNEQGYQKAGLAYANSSTNGTFIYLGFKPRFFIMKRYDASGGWFCIDSHRKPTNTDSNAFMRMHNRGSEGTGSAGANDIYVDFLSNGVKMRSTDGELNGSLLYWAIAERPFVSSTGIPNTAQ